MRRRSADRVKWQEVLEEYASIHCVSPEKTVAQRFTKVAKKLNATVVTIAEEYLCFRLGRRAIESRTVT